MADRHDLEFTYSLIDRIFRLSLGELADFSGAKYDGDFSLSLEQAQRRKHEYVAEQIGIGPGRRVLDLGCGWGPLLDFVRRRGATGVGVTLSSAQAAACRRHGLDVHLQDARVVEPDTLGRFDAVASLGAFEHFCSPEDHAAGRQDDIYRDLFARIASLLPDNARLYLQTMVFGRNMVPLDAIDITAPRDSDEWYLALMGRQFPGSLLPYGEEQIVRTAGPHFRLVSSESGRLDYIETIRQWRARFAAPSVRKTLLKLRLLPRWLTSADFRLAFTSGVSANSVCFERELLDHRRLVFERQPVRSLRS
jgi:cyclopropane-fatty-acyl-phospholipid synthase